MRRVPLRIGVIGAGYAAEHLHLPAFRRVPDIQVVSIFDVDRRRAELLASRLPGARAQSSVDAIIADRSLEAVAILTPPATHGALLAEALKERKHVFMEKPLTSVPDEVDGMVETTRASGCVVAIGHNLRCHRLVRRARDLAQSGRLGDLMAIRTVWTSPVRPRPSWMQEPGLAGSVLLEIAVHHVDLFQYLTGNAIRTVHSTMNNGSRDSEGASLSGMLAGGTLFTSLLARQGVYEHNIHVAGSTAAVEFSCQRANSWRLTTQRHLGLRAQVAEASQYLSQLPMLAATLRSGGDWLESYQTQWRAFAAAVREGTPGACTIEEAAAAVRICSRMAAARPGDPE